MMDECMIARRPTADSRERKFTYRDLVFPCVTLVYVYLIYACLEMFIRSSLEKPVGPYEVIMTGGRKKINGGLRQHDHHGSRKF